MNIEETLNDISARLKEYADKNRFVYVKTTDGKVYCIYRIYKDKDGEFKTEGHYRTENNCLIYETRGGNFTEIHYLMLSGIMEIFLNISD